MPMSCLLEYNGGLIGLAAVAGVCKEDFHFITKVRRRQQFLIGKRRVHFDNARVEFQPLGVDVTCLKGRLILARVHWSKREAQRQRLIRFGLALRTSRQRIFRG